LIYLGIGSLAALSNLLFFYSGYYLLSLGLNSATIISYGLAAVVNYFLCIAILFKHEAYWHSRTEILMYLVVVSLGAGIDLAVMHFLTELDWYGMASRICAIMILFIFNFLARKFIVFPQK